MVLCQRFDRWPVCELDKVKFLNPCKRLVLASWVCVRMRITEFAKYPAVVFCQITLIILSEITHMKGTAYLFKFDVPSDSSFCAVRCKPFNHNHLFQQEIICLCRPHDSYRCIQCMQVAVEKGRWKEGRIVLTKLTICSYLQITSA